jgi:hypothetical protein
MKKLFYLLFIVAVLSSCATESSDDINVSDVYQSYLFTYNKTSNNTYACAQFRDGGAFGNDIVLNSPSKVSVNGDVLTHQNFPYGLYYHYYKEYSNELMEASFIFTDKFSSTYANHANLNSLSPIDIPSDFISISKSNDFVFTWVGEPLAVGESVDLEIVGSEQVSEFTQSEEGATSITILKNDLATFQLGAGSIVLQRYSSDDLQESTGKGGMIMLQYQVSKDCNIVE